MRRNNLLKKRHKKMNLNTEDKEKELREQTGEDNAAQEETTPDTE